MSKSRRTTPPDHYFKPLPPERGGRVIVDLPAYVGIQGQGTTYAIPWRWRGWCDCGWIGEWTTGHGFTGPERLAKLAALKHAIEAHDGALTLPT